MSKIQQVLDTNYRYTNARCKAIHQTWYPGGFSTGIPPTIVTVTVLDSAGVVYVATVVQGGVKEVRPSTVAEWIHVRSPSSASSAACLRM
jgi:hypothetical protein